MPLYEYQCLKCKHVFEKIGKVTAARQRECPKCKGIAKRLQSAPAIHFKGAGWYVTDYGRKTEAPSASGQASGDAKPLASSRGEAEKTEKPAAETKEKTEKKEPAKKDQKQK